MPFDGSGNFVRTFPPGGWVGDSAAGIKIKSDRHDAHDDDIAGGLTNTITKDGQSQPTANIPFNGKQIVNLGNPTAADHAATKQYVDSITGWSTSKTIAGAGSNGRLIFSGTGAVGLQFTAADLSWLAKSAETSKTLHRIVLNDKADGTGSDRVSIDESGRINTVLGQVSANLSYDGSNWRTVSPGYGSLLNFTGGDFKLLSNDVASITNPYAAVTLREFFTAQNSVGSTIVTLATSGAAKSNSIRGLVGTELRWIMYLGDGAAESSTRTGSNFQLVSYDNNGANGIVALRIDRGLGLATLYGNVKVEGTLTTDGVVYGNIFENNTGTNLYLRAKNGGQIILRPDADTAAAQAILDNTGGLTLCGGVAAAADGILAGRGFRSKVGMTGAYGDDWMNFNWTGTQLVAYANNTSLGNVSVSCDYRIKKDIWTLPSVWDLVKALRPVRYTQKAYDIWVDDDKAQWGFIAHELQEQLGEHAATGVKDGPDIQSPNIMGILAAVTRALQEAMERIEVLEGAPA